MDIGLILGLLFGLLGLILLILLCCCWLCFPLVTCVSIVLPSPMCVCVCLCVCPQNHVLSTPQKIVGGLPPEPEEVNHFSVEFFHALLHVAFKHVF